MTRSFGGVIAAVLLCVGCGDDDAATDGAPDSGVTDAAVEDGAIQRDSGMGESCATEGETRVVPCERCGMGSQLCEDGEWVSQGCFDTGECEAGAVEEESAADCSSRARLCTGACSWGAWQAMDPAGECEAGAVRTSATGCGAGETREETCSASCQWEPSGDCVPEPLGGFMDPCTTAADCEAGMVCPDGDDADARGNVGFVCTYECESNSQCRDSLVGRPDVECRFGICVQQCFEDSQCPASQSECRGSHPSCVGMIPPPQFCAQPEGFTC